MVSSQPAPLPHMTAEEFVAWSGDGYQGRLELVNGEVRAMSPASGTHALIQANLAYLIRTHLLTTKTPCRVGTEAPVRPRIKPANNVRAPDLAVTCVPPGPDERFFPDPVLIVEVLSPSNQRETWESIWACATILSLSEVAVIDSERIHADVYRKDAETGWPEAPEAVEAGGILSLESIGLAVALAEVYDGTHLGLQGKS